MTVALHELPPVTFNAVGEAVVPRAVAEAWSGANAFLVSALFPRDQIPRVEETSDLGGRGLVHSYLTREGIVPSGAFRIEEDGVLKENLQDSD